MKKDIMTHIKTCDICQRCKYDNAAYPEKLQPLSIPTAIWSEISMYFITRLPKSEGREAIMVVVDKLSMYADLVGLRHPFTATIVVEAFLNNIFKLHGMPLTIVSDRDSVFLSSFRHQFFRLLGVELHISTVYHPQTNGQTKVVN